MSEHHDPNHRERHHTAHDHRVMGAAEWDERYSGEAVWSGEPNQALVAEARELPVGRALDVGCGEGADAVWLARQGWRTTALDISRNAVRRTLAAAEEAGVPVTGVVGAFGEVPLDGPFELVSAMYPVLPKASVSVDDLLTLVAPGGTLLFVHHDFSGHDHQPQWDPAEHLMPTEVIAALRGREGWEVVVDEGRERHVEHGQGAGHSADHVVRARREA